MCNLWFQTLVWVTSTRVKHNVSSLTYLTNLDKIMILVFKRADGFYWGLSLATFDLC